MFENIPRPWLDHYDEDVRPHIEYDHLPVFGYLINSAKKYPDRQAVIFQNKKISYKKLNYLTDLVATNLRKQGIRKGDKVAIMLPNLPQTIISYFGVLKAGAIGVMTNPLYMERELIHHFNDSESRFLIALDRLWPKLEPLLPRFPLEKIFFTSISESLSFPLNLLYPIKAKREGTYVKVPYNGKNILKWKLLLKKTVVMEPEHIDPSSNLALLQYTGGTTGLSKGVMLTHDNLTANIQQAAEVLNNIGGERHEVFLSLLPFFHVYGLTVCLNLPTLLGATTVPYPQFVPQEVLKAINKYRPTIFPSAPAIFKVLLQQKNINQFNLTSINYCVTGSAPMPKDLSKKFKEITGAEIIEGFGLTEASPITHLNPLKGKKKFGSIGLPFPDTDAAIVDIKTGTKLLPSNEPGELIIRGPQVMKGYWKKPEETKQTLRNGWLYTGDIAYMDDEGYFFIVDRKKDLIISGGYNIYPREIEEVLYEHPKVADAAVIGVSHKTRGEIVKAYIVPKPGVTLDKREIISFCRQKLANYKVPKKIEIRDELPKTVIGKVLKKDLRKELNNKPLTEEDLDVQEDFAGNEDKE